MKTNIATPLVLVLAVVGLSLSEESAASKTRQSGKCQNFVGQVIEPQLFSNVVTAYADLPEKSEFETTAQYEARRANALASANGKSLTIALEPTDRKYFEYDADLQHLNIIKYAFDNIGFPAQDAFYAAGFRDRIEVSDLFNLDLVVSEKDEEAGTYEASNAYGAKVQVQKINRTTEVVFQDKLEFSDEGLFPNANKEPYSLGYLELSPEQAKALKPSLKLAMSIVPKEPYLVSGTHLLAEATIRNPREVTQSFTILIADFQCGLVMDAENKVLAAYVAR
jgi:hypothetical protein